MLFVRVFGASLPAVPRWSTAAGAAFLVLPPMRLRARLSSADKVEPSSQRCLVSSRRAFALASLLCCRSSSAFLARQFKLVPFEPILQSCVHRSAICVAGDRTVRPGAWRWDDAPGRYSSASTASRLWTAAADQGSDSKKEKVRTMRIFFYHAFVILIIDFTVEYVGELPCLGASLFLLLFTRIMLHLVIPPRATHSPRGGCAGTRRALSGLRYAGKEGRCRVESFRRHSMRF